MKTKVFLIIMLLILFGCSHHFSTIKDVKAKHGEPSKTEEKQNTINYFYFYKVRFGTAWAVYEVVTDKQGNVLEERKYYRQPDIPPK